MTSAVDLWGCERYEYKSFFFSRIYTEWVVIPGGTPIEVGSVKPGIKKTLWAWLIDVGAEQLVDVAKELMLPLWNLYKAYGNGVSDPTRADAEDEMRKRGYGAEYEFVSLSFFSCSADYTLSEDTEMGEGIFIDRMSTTWKVVMRRRIE